MFDPLPEDLANMQLMMLNMDPPRHTKLRSLVSKGFTPVRIQAIERHVREVCAKIVDAVAGEVEHAGKRLRIAAARGRENGERVLILIRPETLELTASANGAGAAANTLTGEVVTHTFLGPVTRVKVISPSSELIADLPTARAEALPPGARVTAHVPADTARLLSLPEDHAETAAAIAEEEL
jgi:hypothetical protein